MLSRTSRLTGTPLPQASPALRRPTPYACSRVRTSLTNPCALDVTYYRSSSPSRGRSARTTSSLHVPEWLQFSEDSRKFRPLGAPPSLNPTANNKGPGACVQHSPRVPGADSDTEDVRYFELRRQQSERKAQQKPTPQVRSASLPEGRPRSAPVRQADRLAPKARIALQPHHPAHA